MNEQQHHCAICGFPCDATGYCQRHLHMSPGWVAGKAGCGCLMILIPIGLGFLLMSAIFG